VLIAAIHRDWGEAQGNYDEFRFFTGLRPFEEIALVVTDYDATHGILSITKARVNGIDKDVTKTGEDRRLVLCPRAIAVIERQLRLRDRLVRAGTIDHEHLFFTDSGAPLPDVKYPYVRWQRTLRRLSIRYRKPYMARHTSVSWSLMIGRNPLLVAKEHGHRLTTMQSVYAAWTEGAVETDVVAIRDAMNRTDGREQSAVLKLRLDTDRNPAMGARMEGRRRGGSLRLDVSKARGPGEMRFGSGFASREAASLHKALKFKKNFGGKGGTRTLDPGIMSAVL